jgi:hypothetical protein
MAAGFVKIRWKAVEAHHVDSECTEAAQKTERLASLCAASVFSVSPWSIFR